jgi:hypothetical protein
LTTILPQIYRLRSHERRIEVRRARRVATIRRRLHGREWLFVGDRFITVDIVAFSTSSLVNIDCEPYFYKLPNELRIFAPFLRQMGVRESFQTLDYLDVLNGMAAMYGSSSASVVSSSASSQANSLSARDLEPPSASSRSSATTLPRPSQPPQPSSYPPSKVHSHSRKAWSTRMHLGWKVA